MQLGRYVIQKELGRGGMGIVYQAWDPQFQRPVAIKMLLHGGAGPPASHASFEQEARTIASLEHAAIVPVYDVSLDHAQPFLVMRLMQGGTLADRLKGGALPLAQTLLIIRRLCSALEKAHAKGILHLDIKPANILFDEEGMPYLADFGIAAWGREKASAAFGTPAYMPPEQARGDSLDGRADLYQLGVMLFEMLTGRLPFSADSLIALQYQHAHLQPPSVRQHNPRIPVALDQIVQRTLSKNPAHRFGSARELGRALRRATGPVGANPLLPLGLALIALVALFLFLSPDSSPPDRPINPGITQPPRLSSPVPSATATRVWPDRSDTWIMLVLDASDSMQKPFSGSSRFQAARDEIKQVMAEWNPTVHTGLTVFGHTIRALEPGDCGPTSHETFSPAPDYHLRMATALDAAQPRGMSPLISALDSAAKTFFTAPRTARKAVIMIVDGADNCDPDQEADQLLARLRQYGLDGFPVYIAAIEPSPQDQEKLQRLANLTGGEYAVVHNRQALRDRLAHFHDLIMRTGAVHPQQPLLPKSLVPIPLSGMWYKQAT